MVVLSVIALLCCAAKGSVYGEGSFALCITVEGRCSRHLTAPLDLTLGLAALLSVEFSLPPLVASSLIAGLGGLREICCFI